MSVAAPVSSLTSGRLLARNAIWNLLGLLLPMAVGVVTVPPLVRGLGVVRFGVLSLAWVVIGYFSLFDLGIGRALTKLVADKLGAKQESSIPPLVWTSMQLMLLLGIFGSLVALGISPWLVRRALKIPASLQAETLLTFYLLASSVPLVTLTSGLRGFLEAQQRFRILTLIRIPMSLFSFVGPLLVLPFSHSLVPIMVVLMAGRLVACGAHLLACFSAMPALRRNFALQRSVITPVVRFGGWMTVTNVVGPIMIYMDRFLVSALLSVGMVAYYSVPFDVVTRLLVIPAGLSGVLFPALAVSLAQDRRRTGVLLGRGIKYIFLAVFPIAIAVVTLAPEALRLWLGPSFAQNGSPVLRWLTAGVFVNAVAFGPFILIQSAGRPDLIAKLEVAQVPVYLAGLWLLTTHFGLAGTAFAWTARIVLDTVILFWCSDRLFQHEPKFLLKLVLAMAGALTLLWLATIPEALSMKAVFLSVTLLAFVVAVWFWVLGSGERVFLAGIRIGTSIQSQH
jgi:O-antigen/teichoic acid export membrane protein